MNAMVKDVPSKIIPIETERDVRLNLAAVYRLLAHFRMDDLIFTHASARVPGEDAFLINPFGLLFREVTPSNLVKLDFDGRPVGSEHPANAAGFVIHGAILRARPDVNCIIHTHAVYTAALSMLEVPLEVSHMDNCVLYDDVAFVAKWPGVPVGNDEGELISSALGNKSALMLSHHGLLIAAPTIEEACIKALAFERAAKMQLIAAAAGKIKPIEVELGKEAHDWILKPRRNTAAFNYYARRALRKPINHDCIELCAESI